MPIHSHCQPVCCRSANVPQDSCEAVSCLCNRALHHSLLKKLSIPKAHRDRNASTAAYASKKKLLCSYQISAYMGWAEAAVTKPADCVCSHCKSLLIIQALSISMPGKMQYWKQNIDSHVAVPLKDRLYQNVTLYLPGQNCSFTYETRLFSGTDRILIVLARETRDKQDWDTLRTALAVRVGFPLNFYRIKENSLCCAINRAIALELSCAGLDAQHTFKGTVEDLIWPLIHAKMTQRLLN